MRALQIAATGMSAQQMRVEVISNNLANMSTTGYNPRRAEFADLQYQQVTRPGTLTATNGAMVPAGVQQLRVPYRIGYTALAAFRFVPRFGYELDVIRQAHRVRGAHGGRGPFAAAARWWGYVVPLLAGGIRHAERVALAMDARAFGAHADRTERHLVPWRGADTALVPKCDDCA